MNIVQNFETSYLFQKVLANDRKITEGSSGGCLIHTPAQSRASFQVRSGCLAPFPVKL